MYELRTLCHTCGTNIDETLATELFNESNSQLLSVLEDITNLFLEYDNNLPEYVCHDCKVLLNKVVEFRTQCLKTHKKLLEFKKREIQKSAKYDELLENCVKQEDDQIPVVHHIDEEDDNEDFYETDIEEEAAKKDETPTHSMAKDKPIKKPKRVKKRNLQTWICELCGGEFKCSTYLKLHLLRHTGKKEFECDICQAKYYTDNEMRRHRILHTDARPYSCRFCDKTFRGCSSRAVHERTHTNERPFACQYCDKSFTSTSTRQMHERVHTNNRKYHCEPCDQWFLRSSHLLLHQRTKLHKRRATNVNASA